MRTRTVLPPSVARTHSCSAVYFRSSGTSDIHGPPVCVAWPRPYLPGPVRSAARVGVWGRAQLPGGGDRYRIVFGDGQFAAGGPHGGGDAAQQVERGVE